MGWGLGGGGAVGEQTSIGLRVIDAETTASCKDAADSSAVVLVKRMLK